MRKFKILKLTALLPIVLPIALPITSCSNSKVILTFKNPIKGGKVVGDKTITISPNTKWYKVTNLPKVQADEGYQFMYWTNNGDKLDPESVVTSNMNVTPRFGLKDTPIIENVDKLTVSPWTYDAQNDKYVQQTASITIPNFYNFNNSHVGYVAIEDYLTNFNLSTYITATTDHTTHKTTIKNVRYSDEGGLCILDYKNQTITFNEYEKFIDFNPSSYGPMTTGVTGFNNYWNSVTVKNYNKGFSTVLDLKKYGIEIYEYAEDSINYKAYVPYEFYKNVFSLNFAFDEPDTTLKNKIFDFNGKGLFEIISGALEVKSKIKALEAAGSEFYDSDYLEYCYNLMAFSLDTRYGIVDRIRRSNGEYVKFLEHGAYDALKDYHDGMMSKEADVSNNSMRSFFKEKLDDGGHSGYVFNNVFTKTIPTKNEEIFGDECMWKSNLGTSLKKAREKAQLSTQSVVNDGYKEYTKEGSTDKIAYVTFDNFVEASGYTNTEEETKKRELPSGTTDENYKKDTLRLTMYANDKIQKDSNIKDVVIDLSCNGGGAAYSCIFIASWLCGGITEKIYNPHSKSYNEYQVKADINGDGSFDENDYLSPDINLYVLTSSISFSCGNLLPTNIQDCRPNKTTFVGTKSGGGSCYVDTNVMLGMNAMCQFSSSIHILRQEATYGNFIDNENGNSITAGWEIDQVTSKAAYYDRNSLNKKIWEA